MNIKQKVSEGRILTRIIIEVMGSPKEYIENSLKLAVDNLKKRESNIEIIKEYFFPAEEKEKMFSTFTELEILFKNAFELVNFCFEYAPSSIEILEPQNLNYQAREFSNILNDLLGKIHSNAMTIKNYTAENQILKKNASTLLQNLIILSLKEKDKNLNGLSKHIGVNEEKLKEIMEEFVKNNIIIRRGDKYAAKED